jgi:uncharacterized protein
MSRTTIGSILDRPEALGISPEKTAQPVAQTERIRSLDVLRGFALLGILLMNIASFALPDWNYPFPLATVKPVFSGPHAHINTFTWFLRWVLAEGKMRGLFSMLFGAGVVLITQRAEKRGAGIHTADIFCRRNMWLALFGVLHCYLIWQGDILFYYGITGLVFLFPARNLKPKTLILTGVAVLLFNSFHFLGSRYLDALHKKEAAEKALAVRNNHGSLNHDQSAAISEWQAAQEEYRPGEERLYSDIAKMHAGYWSSTKYLSSYAFVNETAFFYLVFGDVLGMMLIGMALYRNGFLTGELSAHSYLLCAVTGLGVAWSAAFASGWHAWKSGFDQIETLRAMMLSFDLSRLGGAIGSAAVILFMIKRRIFPWILDRIANVGQMALSNYLLTSICMRLVFVWTPLHWYGYLEYYQLYYVVGAMWLINLVWSSLWLRFFRFGPVEWLWRSLTYLRLQPMKVM